MQISAAAMLSLDDQSAVGKPHADELLLVVAHAASQTGSLRLAARAAHGYSGWDSSAGLAAAAAAAFCAASAS